MGLLHVAYNEYVWKALFLYRHPERSRGIFLAGGENVVCVIAEKGKPFSKGARKRGVRVIFLAFAGNVGMGDGYPASRMKDMLGKRCFRNVIPSEVEGSFLHTGIAPYVRQRKRGNLLRKEQERTKRKEDFSLRSK